MLLIKVQLSLVLTFPLTVTKLIHLNVNSIECQLVILVADFFSNHVLYFVSAVSSISAK